MKKRLFIDTAHPEEIRVALVNEEGKLEKFESEISSRSIVRGNIYLAKIIRVEPSLQAAFVDYGGGRHGFLGFSEIHHSYYQIPVSDREELEKHIQNALQMREEKRKKKEANAEDEEVSDTEETDTTDSAYISKLRHQFYKRYRIQEVIKKRQVLLVQVMKEERGNKGAALTTFISLAGRYCVVMPNTDRPCGISKKIVSTEDRKKMKDVLSYLNVPEGMCAVIRTSGVNYKKQEIKKDFEFVLKTWDEVRQNTLTSTAPSLIHEEASLIKRTLRDFYQKDIAEVIVDGEDGYKTVKSLMRKMLPSHAKKVSLYSDKSATLFGKYDIEEQINTMYATRVDLPSGGYLVINPTEAMISIDVNSGKMTKERNIGATALKTNLEAAVEVARQCKLRDFGGLIVVDFIDMPEDKNDALLEKTVKEAFADDRAKVQTTRISTFGLMEISRQRLHPNLMETHRIECPHCSGTGTIWSIESIAVRILRKIDEVCTTAGVKEVKVSIPLQLATFIINNKRDYLANVEKDKGCKIVIDINTMMQPQDYKVSIIEMQTKAIEKQDEEEEEQSIVTVFNAQQDKPKQNTKQKNRYQKRQKNDRYDRKKTQKQEEVADPVSDEQPKELAVKEKDDIPKEEEAQPAMNESLSLFSAPVAQDIKIDTINARIQFERNYSDLIKKSIQVREEIGSQSQATLQAVQSGTYPQQIANTKKGGWWSKLLKN